jgi:hypothetical protein
VYAIWTWPPLSLTEGFNCAIPYSGGNRASTLIVLSSFHKAGTIQRGIPGDGNSTFFSGPKITGMGMV